MLDTSTDKSDGAVAARFGLCSAKWIQSSRRLTIYHDMENIV
jgi:hypothetical protein